MSCIAGILHLDGTPVERQLVERMTAAMGKRAPDASGIWCSGNIGLGHALLRISPVSESENQPCTLQGNVWITADARIDGRQKFVSELRAAGVPIADGTSDTDLILYAYDVYGESLVEHIIGDFAFALWDMRRRRLICARDHFGVRPFYYARTEKSFLFASTLEAILAVPDVSKRVDEEAVGDFLLFGMHQNGESTIYKDVHCLPAANQISVSAESAHRREYWSLIQYAPTRYRTFGEYQEHFREVLVASVDDRIAARRVGLELSGGMDSSSIAAIAATRADTYGRTLTGYTNSAKPLIAADDEAVFAQTVASHLAIPILVRELGVGALFDRRLDNAVKTQEPSANPFLAFFYETFSALIAAGAHVVVTGQGGDEVFNSSSASYLSGLLKKRKFAEFFTDVFAHLWHTGSLRGLGLRSAIAEILGKRRDNSQSRPSDVRFPDWLNRDFAARTNLKYRWESIWARMLGNSDSLDQLHEPWLSRLFASYEMFDLPLIACHPYFDVRLVSLMLRFPGFVKKDKTILRHVMQAALPRVILDRPKTSAVGDVARAALAGAHASESFAGDFAEVSLRFVDSVRYREALKRYVAGEGASSTWSSIPIVSPLGLDSWLRQHEAIC
jgi:asparagine synthase (glutamine-hydrolysing)